MGNLIYVLVIIAYFIYQAVQAKKRREEQENVKRRPGDNSAGESGNPSPASRVDERMKEIFREMEMKNKPYARPYKKEVPVQKSASLKVASSQKAAVKKQLKKTPAPFLNVDMTEEGVQPEGTPSKMAEDGYAKDQVTNFDYNAVAKSHIAQSLNLRQAVIAKIILDRPEW